MQAAHLEAQLAVVAGDHERLQQRFVQLEGELESVRRSASQEQARLAGHASALATELEEERRASAQALSYQLGEVQSAAEEAGAVADQLKEAQREAAAARALADEIKEARAAAAAAASMGKEFEALRQEAASARGLAARLQVAEQELAHAKTLAAQLEEERAVAAAAQAACHTAKGRNALLEKAWSTALEVRACLPGCRMCNAASQSAWFCGMPLPFCCIPLQSASCPGSPAARLPLTRWPSPLLSPSSLAACRTPSACRWRSATLSMPWLSPSARPLPWPPSWSAPLRFWSRRRT